MTGFDMKYTIGMRRFDLCRYLFYFFLKEDLWQHEMDTQPAFTCSKSRIEIPEQCVTNFIHCSGVSIFDFGQVNAGWDGFQWTWNVSTLSKNSPMKLLWIFMYTLLWRKYEKVSAVIWTKLIMSCNKTLFHGSLY